MAMATNQEPTTTATTTKSSTTQNKHNQIQPNTHNKPIVTNSKSTATKPIATITGILQPITNPKSLKKKKKKKKKPKSSNKIEIKRETQGCGCYRGGSSSWVGGHLLCCGRDTQREKGKKKKTRRKRERVTGKKKGERGGLRERRKRHGLEKTKKKERERRKKVREWREEKIKKKIIAFVFVSFQICNDIIHLCQIVWHLKHLM